MGLQEIGLEGVFRTEAFASGLSKYTSGLTSAGSMTKSVAGGLGSILSTGLTVAAGAFVALGTAAVVAAGVVVGAISKMVFDSANLADQLATMAGQTGISITRLQEMAYAGTLLDVDLETMTSAQKFLTKAMYAGRDGTGEQAAAFKALGIKIVDAKGHLLDSSVIFGKTIDALGKMTNETERDAMAMKLMGRNAMELNPLIKAGSKTLAEYSAEAHTMGAVVSEEGILALDLFKDRLDALKLSFKGIAAQGAIYFLPFFADIEDAVRGMVADFVSTGDIGVLADDIAETLDRIMGNFTTATPLFVKKLNKFIMKIRDIFIAKLPVFVKVGGELLSTLIEGASAAFPYIVDFAISVGRTLWFALQKAAPSLLAAGGDLINALGVGIEDALSGLPTFSEIVNWIFKTAVDLTAQFKTWFGGIKWAEISQSVIDAINAVPWAEKGEQLRTAADKIGVALINAFNEIKWEGLGVSIGTGFVDFVLGFLQPGQNLDTLRQTWTDSLMVMAQGVIDAGGWGAYGRKILDKIWASGYQPNAPDPLKDELNREVDNLKNAINADIDLLKTFAAKVTPAALDEITKIINGVGPSVTNLGTKFVTWFSDAFSTAWATCVTTITTNIGKLVKWVSDEIGYLTGLLTSPFTGKKPVAPTNPFAPATTVPPYVPVPSHNIPPTTPTVPIQPTNPLLNNRYNMGMGGNSANTYNVTVNNPSAEPASTSVDKTLRKLSYLGAI